ncbi:MAG: DUF3014 domain-containing protein [Burkholderiaceae bacterium]
MNKTTRWLLAATLLGATVIVLYLWHQSTLPEPQLLYPVEAPTSPAAVVAESKSEPAIRYPIQESQAPQAESKTLPALTASDPAIWDALIALFGQTPVQQLFHPQEIVRRIVVTVDNLPRQSAAARLLPIKPVDGKFRTAGQAENLAIAPENAARYTRYVDLAEMTDAGKFVALYVRYYPLFQRAYQDLGYPNGYFNDRLVAVIDHLLAAPEVDAPVALVQPHVLYELADPGLQTRSAGHKILVRMGSKNAARIKAKLREIRAALVGGIPK